MLMKYASISILLLFLAFVKAGFSAESVLDLKASPATTNKASESKDKKTKTPTRQRFKGEIESFDKKVGTVKVKGASEEKSFVTQDAAKDSLEVLKPGERVRVTYSEKEGKLVATSLARLKPKNKTPAEKQKNPNTSAKPTGKEDNKWATK
jgi:ribosomal protein S1